MTSEAPNLRVVAVNGSPTDPSRSRQLAQRALELLGGGQLIDLATLDPAALLYLGSDAAVDQARDAIAASDILVVATPIYRATYTALLKTIFDLQPQDSLVGTVVVPIATGYGPHHQLAIDHGLRPLIASLGGWATATGIYATNADIVDGVIAERIQEQLASATTEARHVAHALASAG